MNDWMAAYLLAWTVLVLFYIGLAVALFSKCWRPFVPVAFVLVTAECIGCIALWQMGAPLWLTPAVVFLVSFMARIQGIQLVKRGVIK